METNALACSTGDGVDHTSSAKRWKQLVGKLTSAGTYFLLRLVIVLAIATLWGCELDRPRPSSSSAEPFVDRTPRPLTPTPTSMPNSVPATPTHETAAIPLASTMTPSLTSQPVPTATAESGGLNQRPVATPTQAARVQPSPTATAVTVPPSIESRPEVTAVREIVLEAVNQGRRHFDLPQLELGDSAAAQLDAEWSLANLELMNYEETGRPIEFLYTALGGRGHLQRRGHIRGYFDTESIERCTSPRVICTRMELHSDIERYVADALGRDARKGGDFLLSPHAATLHLGIAHTDFTLVIVTYVERLTLEYAREPTVAAGYLDLTVDVRGGQAVRSIQVFHYPSPSSLDQEIAREKVMAVFRPPESGRILTLPDDRSVVADYWSDQGDETSIVVVVDRHLPGPGVYELLVWTDTQAPGSQYFLEVRDPDALVLELARRPFEIPTPPTVDELREYALELINRDRRDHGVPPVRLGDNAGAQVHAEDALRHGYLVGHWTSDGLKPYMLYREAGGLGVVAENAAGGGVGDPEECRKTWNVCGRIDLRAKIADLEWGMMYDDAHADWGHRDTIINPDYDTVNLGIAFDDVQLRFYQHFEYVGVSYEEAPSLDEGELTMTVSPLAGHRVGSIALYFDPPPTPRTAEEIERLKSYCTGGGFTDECNYVRSVARVLKPAPEGSHYVDLPPEEVVADVWSEGPDGTLEVRADLGDLVIRPGVYTVMLFDDGDSPRRLSGFSVFK